MEDIEDLRQSITKIDEELVRLFEERVAVAARVGKYKEKNNLKIYDPIREAEILRKFTEGSAIDIKKEYLEQFLKNLMFLSRRVQEDIRREGQGPSAHQSSVTEAAIGYQGVPGCYSCQAGIEHFGEGVNSLSYQNFRDVFAALRKGDIQYGILPIENSTSGSINEVYDLLREYEFYILGEKYLKIDHSLLGVEGAGLSDIREVYSHQQGLIQCSRYLSEHPEWEQRVYYDTAGSAELIAKEGCRSKACIAGGKAAEIYGLSMISENIQDNTDNSTRFVIVGKDSLEDKDADKVSIIISVSHKPGSLYGILRHFAETGRNLMKLESRPIEGRAWEYFFYVDFSGNTNEKATGDVLKIVEKECSYFRLLGNYKSETL